MISQTQPVSTPIFLKGSMPPDSREGALGYGYLNEEFEVSDVTPAAVTVLGRSREEIIGRSLDTLLEEVNPSPRSLGAVDPVALGQEYIVKGTSGSLTYIRMFVIPSAPRGSKTSIFVVEDVTDSKKPSGSERNQEQWHRLFRNASHDMREPLRMVCTYLGLIKAERESQLDETGREYLAFANEGAVRLRRQTESLLRLLSFEFQEFRFSLVSMDDALACALKGLTKPIADKKAQIKTLPLVSAWANTGLMVDLFQALLDNALKFAVDKPPHLEVQSHTEGEEVVYTISDNGDGVPPDKLEEIFHPFRRLRPREFYMGEGLGLTLSRKIVQIHGGRIWAERSPTGFRVRFSLPIGDRQ